ncbi:MAG: beta-phosphoglucomutase [Sphingobacteriales bacterium]|jgi:beta-phosphoglucomutase|nr:beta-phosphoglucomutase [Sphingobacteriales bacterium]
MKACIFDLDGVLVDTAKYHFVAWKRLANELGVDFTEHDNENLKGLSRDASLNYILAKTNIVSTSSEREVWKERKNNWYLDLVTQMPEDEVLPNCKELLKSLKDNHIKISLGSASKNAKLILDRVNITHYFDAIIDGTKTSKSKPDPEVFLLGAAAMNCDPSECIVFEDAISGVKAAKTGGFFTIGIGEPEVLSEADVVYPDLNELNYETLMKIFTVA